MHNGPKSGNGYVPKDMNLGSSSLPTKEKVKEVHNALMQALWKMWREHKELHKPLEEGIYSRISILTATQMAAITAIDVGLPEEQFLDICRENYQEAYRRTPKFG